MTFIPRGPKQAVNVTLSEDLVRYATAMTSNLSDTVEKLLADFIEAEHRRREQREHLIDETIQMINDHEAQYGLWGEEYCTL